MDSDQLTRWLSLGANVGILAGLILVGLEIGQNSTLARAQIVDSNISDQEAREHARMGEDSARIWAKSIEQPDQMTLAEVAVLEAELSSRLLNLRRAALMEEIGVYTGQWRGQYEWFSRPFTTPIGRAYWNYWYDDSIDWMREMHPLINAAPPTTESEFLSLLQDSLASE